MTTSRKQQRSRQGAVVKIKKGTISFDESKYFGYDASVEATDIVIDGEAVAFKDASGKIAVVPFSTIGMIRETD